MNSKYFPKIVAGLVVFVAIVGLHAAVDLGSLWIVVAGALAGAAGMLMPEGQEQKSLEGKPIQDGKHSLEKKRHEPFSKPAPTFYEVPTESLQGIRTHSKHLKESVRVSGQQRQEFYADLDHFYSTCKDVVHEWDHLAADPPQENKVRRILDVYFPETCRILDDMPTATHNQAVEDFRASLAVLQSEMDKVHQAIMQDNLQELKDNRTFLELEFGVLRKPEE